MGYKFKPEHLNNQFTRLAIVLTAIGGLANMAVSDRTQGSPLDTVKMAKTMMSPCGDTKLQEREFLVGCVRDVLRVMRSDLRVREAYNNSISYIAMLTEALDEGTINPAQYISAVQPRFAAMGQSLAHDRVTTGWQVPMVVADMRDVLAHRKSGVAGIMTAARLEHD